MRDEDGPGISRSETKGHDDGGQQNQVSFHHRQCSPRRPSMGVPAFHGELAQIVKKDDADVKRKRIRPKNKGKKNVL